MFVMQTVGPLISSHSHYYTSNGAPFEGFLQHCALVDGKTTPHRWMYDQACLAVEHEARLTVCKPMTWS